MKEKNNINACNISFFQSLNSYSTDNIAKALCCLPTTWRRRRRRQTDNKQQRNAKINGRGMRKRIGTAGSPGTGSRKNFQTSGNKHLFKYINIYNRVYQRYTGPEKERKQRETGMKDGWEELKKRNAGTEDYWSKRELQKQNAKKKNRSGNTKREMKKWYTNAEKEWRKNMQNTDIKEKIPVYSWIHKDQLKAMENKNKRKQLINNILYIHIITY